jgi:hypothetical protein
MKTHPLPKVESCTKSPNLNDSRYRDGMRGRICRGEDIMSYFFCGSSADGDFGSILVGSNHKVL